MLESVLREKMVEKRPEYAFALGIIFATIGLAMSILIFKDSPSFPAIFLTTLAAAPIAIKMLKKEEKGKDIYHRYSNVIKIYSYLFFGMAAAFALWFLILPEQFISVLFREQLLKFTVGYFSFQRPEFFSIVINNTGLLFFFFLMSLFYGAGSMFLLSWNASILGTMWGNTMKTALAVFNPGIFIVNTLAALPYLLPEVAAYFFAAIAGAILSINFENKKKFDIAMRESVILLMVSIAMIIVAGAVETVILGI